MGTTARTARAELLDIAASMDLDDPIIEGRQAVNALSIRLVLDLYTAISDWADDAAVTTADWTSTGQPSRSNA